MGKEVNIEKKLKKKISSQKIRKITLSSLLDLLAFFSISLMSGFLLAIFLPHIFFETKAENKELSLEIQSRKSDSSEAKKEFFLSCQNEISEAFKNEISEQSESSYRNAMNQVFVSNLQPSEMVSYVIKIVRHLRRNLLEICHNPEKIPACISPESHDSSGRAKEYCTRAVDKYVDIALLDAEILLNAEIEEKDIDFLTEKFVVIHRNIKELNEYFYYFLAKFSDFNKKFSCYIDKCQM